MTTAPNILCMNQIKLSTSKSKATLNETQLKIVRHRGLKLHKTELRRAVAIILVVPKYKFRNIANSK